MALSSIKVMANTCSIVPLISDKKPFWRVGIEHIVSQMIVLQLLGQDLMEGLSYKGGGIGAAGAAMAAPLFSSNMGQAL